MDEDDDSPRVLSPEQTRRRQRRSIALALALALLVVLFYIMAIAQGPSILNRPI